LAFPSANNGGACHAAVMLYCFFEDFFQMMPQVPQVIVNDELDRNWIVFADVAWIIQRFRRKIVYHPA